MKLKLYPELNKAINFLTVCLLCSFTIFTTYSWGRYVMFGCITLIFCVQVWKNGGKYKLSMPTLTTIIALFTLYCMMGALWAERPSETITMSKTLFEIVIMVYVLHACYIDNAYGVTDLLRCIKWSSYIISIYSIFFYGIDFLIKAAVNEMRLDNAYVNVNTIGMLAAIGIVIQLDEILREKKLMWESLMCIPSIIIVALTQSRKALLVLIFGIFFCFIFHNIDSKNIIKTVIKLLVILPVVLLLLYSIISLPIFSGVINRVNSLLLSVIGENGVDSSTLIRNKMIEIGWKQFLKTPLSGMGIANAHLLSSIHLGIDTYLHNNYIELLVGGGIIGFVLYYSMYVYLLTIFFRLRKYKNREYVICLVLTILLLMLDFGMVSYYQKIRYIYLLVLFLEVESLKKERQRQLKR